MWRCRIRVLVAIVVLGALAALFCVWKVLPTITRKQDQFGGFRRALNGTPASERRSPEGEPVSLLRYEGDSKLALSDVGGLTWSCTPCATFEERTGRALTIYRLDAKGNICQLGQHALADDFRVSLVNGPGSYYGLFVSRSGIVQKIRVFKGASELYEVSADMVTWDGMRLADVMILAGGCLLASYSPAVPPTSVPRGDREFVVAIISKDKSGVRRRELYRGVSRLPPRHMVSGDGSVLVATSPEGGQTTVYSADGAEQATIQDFFVTSVSYDGKTLAGRRKGRIAVFRGGQCIGERPSDPGVAVVYLSANGEYVLPESLASSAASLLTSSGLRDVYRVTAPQGFHSVATCSPSSAGQVAVTWGRGDLSTKEGRACRDYQLIVYGVNGQILLRRDMKSSDEHGFPTSRLIWSMDGHVLIYQDKDRRSIVQYQFSTQDHLTTEERGTR